MALSLFVSTLSAYPGWTWLQAIAPKLHPVKSAIMYLTMMFMHAGPFIKLGPLLNVGKDVAERAGCLSKVLCQMAHVVYSFGSRLQSVCRPLHQAGPAQECGPGCG